MKFHMYPHTTLVSKPQLTSFTGNSFVHQVGWLVQFSHIFRTNKKREREPSPLHCIVRYYVQHNASNNVCFNFHHISMHSRERGCASLPHPLHEVSPFKMQLVYSIRKGGCPFFRPNFLKFKLISRIILIIFFNLDVVKNCSFRPITNIIFSVCPSDHLQRLVRFDIILYHDRLMVKFYFCCYCC